MELESRSIILPMFYDFPSILIAGEKGWRSGQSGNSGEELKKKKKKRHGGGGIVRWPIRIRMM